MSTSRDVEKAVGEVVRRSFGAIGVVDVEVVEDLDHDGDPILRVRVVFDAEVEDLDPSELLETTRHLRSRLRELEVESFPVTSFISRKDFEGMVA